MSLFGDIAKSMAKPNPYKKASKHGMVGGDIKKQTGDVMSRRRERENSLLDDISGRREELLSGDDFEDAVDREYDDYIAAQMDALREELEGNRPSRWSDEVFDDEAAHLDVDWTPDTFESRGTPMDYLDGDDLNAMNRLDRMEHRINNLPSLSKNDARRRTYNFANWKKALATADKNKEFGHKMAQLNAIAKKGNVTMDANNPLINGKGPSVMMDDIIQNLRNKGYDDDAIKKYLLGTKVQH